LKPNDNLGRGRAARSSNQPIEDLLAWGFASAIAVVLLASTLVLLAVYNRFAGLDRLWG
jgi:putative spermidine/putrescine transport system permease protein